MPYKDLIKKLKAKQDAHDALLGLHENGLVSPEAQTQMQAPAPMPIHPNDAHYLALMAKLNQLKSNK